MKNKIVILVILLVVVSNSQSWARKTYDFVTQPSIYTYTNYTTSKKWMTIFLIDVIDKRPEVEKSGGLLDYQTVDIDWKRPLDEMMADLFTKELQRSGLMKLIPATPKNSDYKLRVEILSFYGGTKEKVTESGFRDWFVPRQAVGNAKLKILLWDKSGKELMDVDFIATSEQDTPRMSGYHGYAIKNACNALRETILQILKDLDLLLK